MQDDALVVIDAQPIQVEQLCLDFLQDPLAVAVAL